MKNKELIELYKSNPCRLHATALWKTLVKDNLEIELVKDNNGCKTIKIYDDTTLFLYWSRDNDEIGNVDKFELCLFHVKQFDKSKSLKESADGYFRLKYSGNKTNTNNTNLIIKSVDILNEAKHVSDFISKCYKDLKPSEKEVLSWTEHPVFKNDLWIWIVDSITEEYLGLGIAEYDKNIKEGSLEWIQVLPKHSGKGIGKIIVAEIVNRMEYADLITVSSRADNIAAEKLYRSCGFEGDDIWYVVTK